MRPLPRLATSALAGAIASLLLLGAPGAVAAPARGWSQPERVTLIRNATLSALHEVVATGSAINLVHARIGPHSRDDHVVYQRSTNGGRTWSAEHDLFRSGSTYRSVIPNLAIAARGDLVAVAFRARAVHRAALFVRVSRDAGKTFAPRVMLADVAGGRKLGVPALAVADGAVLVAWTDRATGRVRVRRSTNGGSSFTAAKTLAHTGLSISCVDPKLRDGLVGLVAAGSTVHLAWSEAKGGACLAGRVRSRTSNDGGQTFRRARVVTDTTTFGWPELAARGKRLLVSLQRPSGSLVLARSIDSGRTFRQRVLRSTGDRGLGAADILLRPGGLAWVVYPDVDYKGSAVTATRLRIRQSTNNGRTWGPGVLLLPDAHSLRKIPNLVGWRGKPVVVFESDRIDGSRTSIYSMRRT